jgi:hypothetical protein
MDCNGYLPFWQYTTFFFQYLTGLFVSQPLKHSHELWLAELVEQPLQGCVLRGLGFVLLLHGCIIGAGSENGKHFRQN